jgi:hypothetical protein
MFLIHYYYTIVCRNSYPVLTAQLLQTCKSTSTSLYAIRFANLLSFLCVTVASNWFHENRIFFNRASNIKFHQKSPIVFRCETWKRYTEVKRGIKKHPILIRTVQIHLIRDNKQLSSIDTYIFISQLLHTFTLFCILLLHMSIIFSLPLFISYILFCFI